MATPENNKDPKKEPTLPVVFQAALAFFILFGIGYTTAVLCGWIGEKQKLSSINVAILVLVLLAVLIWFRPRILDQISLVEILGVKVQMHRVEANLALQQKQLEGIRLILPLLIPENERKHLLELGKDSPSLYEGRDSLRSELRRLRSVDLIKMKDDKRIADMKNGSKFRLKEYIELKDLGDRWIKRIKELAEAEKPKADDVG